MPKLRKAVIDKLLNTLDGTRFGIASYKASFPDAGSILFAVEFVPVQGYRLLVNELRGTSSLRVDLSPGAYRNTESGTVADMDEVHEWLTAWARYIYEEIRAEGNGGASVADVQESLEEYVSAHVPNPEERFTREELDDVLQRLTDLEEKFKELRSSGQLNDAQLKELTTEVGKASAEAEVLPKGVWYRASLAKVMTVMKAMVGSAEFKKLVVDIVRQKIGLG